MTVRQLPALLLLSAALIGCGEDGREPGRAQPGPPTTRLAVAFDPGGGELAAPGQAGQRLVRCPGDRLCARLARVEASAFDPVPPDVACTEIYGGPQTATVRGLLRGARIDAKFSRSNGCEIARWDRLAWLLVP